MVAFINALPLGKAKSTMHSHFCNASKKVEGEGSWVSVRMSEMSPSMPFLPKPEKLSEDMPGYAGFDPFGISDRMDIRWLQQAEIKHGRVCMLAFAGMLAQEFVHLPNEAYSNVVATDAFYDVPAAAIWQIIGFCGVLEMLLHRGKITYLDMFEDGAVPGELGFNPMGLKITDLSRGQELKNGRLAMCGVGGVIHSMLLYKVPIIAQLLDFQPMQVP